MSSAPRGSFHRLVLAVIGLMAAACSKGTGGFGGCGGGCIAPLPNGFQGSKIENAITARVSQAGFDYLSTNVVALLDAVGQTNPITVPLPCGSASFSGYTAFYCDTNQDGVCSPGEQCTVTVGIQSLSLKPVTPTNPALARVDGAATVTISTSNIALYIPCAINVAGAACHCTCTWWPGDWGCCWPAQCDLRTSADFDSARGTRPNETFTAQVNFSLSPFGKLMTFSVAAIDGVQQIEAADLSVNQVQLCGVLDFTWLAGMIKDPVVNALKPMIQGQIQNIINGFACRSCGAGKPACPSGSTCQGTQCLDPAGTCVPIFLGIEGKMDLGSMFGNFGVPPHSAVDIYNAAGGFVDSATNIHFTAGVIGGAEADSTPLPAACVPDLPAPQPSRPISPPDFQTYGPAGYHIGIAVSEYYLNYAAYAAHRAGAMCLSIGSEVSSLLSTGTFRSFLPSLGLLAGDGTHDSPVAINLRLMEPPTLLVGAGTYDPNTKKPIDPLITASLKNTKIDFYAFIEDRMTRLFTLTADISLPLSIVVEGCPQKLAPAIGDLSKLIVLHPHPDPSELLAEDPALLVNLVPAAIGFLEPAMANVLSGFALPSFNNIKLHIDDIKGVNQIAGTREYEHLGFFAHLIPGSQCASYMLDTQASLLRAEIPSADQMVLRKDQPLPWPKAQLAVAAVDPSLQSGRSTEYAYRVDGGMWSIFYPGPVLEVQHPNFLLQGHHTIEVRARAEGVPETVDISPARVDFLVDWTPPAVKLRADPSSGKVEVLTSDNVTPVEGLRYAYAVGSGAPSGFGPAQLVDLAAVSAQGGVTVQARDEAGNVGSATWKPQAEAGTATVAGLAKAGRAESAFGCSSGGTGGAQGQAAGMIPVLLGLLSLGMARRRKNR